jgi:hypothetical protein
VSVQVAVSVKENVDARLVEFVEEVEAVGDVGQVGSFGQTDHVELVVDKGPGDGEEPVVSGLRQDGPDNVLIVHFLSCHGGPWRKVWCKIFKYSIKINLLYSS